jgi:hypothetical protein
VGMRPAGVGREGRVKEVKGAVRWGQIGWADALAYGFPPLSPVVPDLAPALIPAAASCAGMTVTGRVPEGVE